jgi:hypothetical protein
MRRRSAASPATQKLSAKSSLKVVSNVLLECDHTTAFELFRRVDFSVVADAQHVGGQNYLMPKACVGTKQEFPLTLLEFRFGARWGVHAAGIQALSKPLAGKHKHLGRTAASRSYRNKSDAISASERRQTFHSCPPG